jgi:hypothetical protein
MRRSRRYWCLLAGALLLASIVALEGCHRDRTSASTFEAAPVATASSGATAGRSVSDSDDGKKQKSLLATSKLTFGDASSLGAVKKVDATRAKCVVSGGRLEPRMESPGPDVPLYGTD